MENISNWIATQSKVVTRAGVCPFISAKGSIAIAELRTHLFCYFIVRYAILKGIKGVFILRCDDTDVTRTDTNLMPLIVSMFNNFLEVKPDLHPYNSEQVLKYPLIQSQRKELYREYIERLFETKILYKKSNKNPLMFSIKKYMDFYGNFLKVKDLLLGDISYDLLYERRIHDFPLTRTDGSSLWHLSSVVDDFNADVNLVIRAQDKIGNIPYQELVRSALNFSEKAYIHLPLMMSDKNNVSSLNFLSTVDEFIKKGISSRAIIVYLCSSLFSKSECFYSSINDLLENIDFAHLRKITNRFDMKTLDYVNRTLNVKLSDNDYIKELKKCALVNADKEWDRLLSNNTIKNLLLHLRFDYVRSRATINTLISPTYSLDSWDRNHHLDYIFGFLEKKETHSENLFTIIRELIGLNKIFIPSLRWILTGSMTGISIFKILDFLECSQISLRDRVRKASNIFTNQHKQLAMEAR